MRPYLCRWASDHYEKAQLLVLNGNEPIFDPYIARDERYILFRDRRMNRVNMRKEFFKVPLEEIEVFVNKHTGATITFTKLAEAREYRETMAMLERIANAVQPVEAPQEFPTSLF
jgi:hypothetical protein